MERSGGGACALGEGEMGECGNVGEMLEALQQWRIRAIYAS